VRRPLGDRSVVVVKVGSSSLTGGRPELDPAAVRRVSDIVARFRVLGHRVVLVTSGAVAAGLSALGRTDRPSDLPGLQAAAAVGQSRLMHGYGEAFSVHGLVVGQVLLSKWVLADREQYLHARQALHRMLDLGIVPIVNENDTVAVEELRFGDNDRLAAMVSHLVNASLLLLLTDTAGLLSGDPRSGEPVELLSAVRHTDRVLDRLAQGGAGPQGSGGVATKIAAARMAAWSGIPTVIAPANSDRTVDLVAAGEDIGTWVEPQPRRLPARKLWIAFGQPSEGRITVDAGAVEALVRGGRSLLPVGVAAVEGSFEAGAAVEVIDPSGGLIAKGLSRFGSEQFMERIGARTGAHEVAIHRDDMVVLISG
jgi:glutamate 5-kinase